MSINKTSYSITCLSAALLAASIPNVSTADYVFRQALLAGTDSAPAQTSNEQPIVANAIADQEFESDSPISLVISLNTFNDPDEDTLTLAATLAGGGALPGWISFNSGSRTFSGTPLSGDVGVINVTVTATDPEGASVSDTFALTVTEALATIAGTSGNDTLYGTEDSELLVAGDGNDIIYARGGDDTLQGDAGNDTLYGEGGNDTLHGGSGTDTLMGGDGNDTLSGGPGNNDSLTGGFGSDTYLWNLGDGNTNISNYDTSAGRNDVLIFGTGISPSGVTITRNTNNLTLTIQSSGETIAVSNYFTSSLYALNAIQFSDGTVWDEAAVINMSMQGTPGNDTLQGFDTDDTIDGGDGNDFIYGRNGNDTLYGGTGNDGLYGDAGNDMLYGGDGSDSLSGGDGDDTLSGGPGSNDSLSGNAGNDTYLWSLGDGNTNISNYDISANRNDVLIFGTGIIPADVTVTRSTNNLLLTIQGSGEVVAISSYFTNSFYVLNAIQFSDSTLWDEATVIALSMQGTPSNDNLKGFETDDTIHGGDGNDTISGEDGNDTLYGDAGNDTISGGNGNDVLYGGDGSDSLYGGNGDDTLNSGTGINISLRGDAGNDTYLWNLGDGNVNISNYDLGAGRNDVLVFGAGISPNDVVVSRAVNSLKLTIQTTGAVISVINYFSGSANALNAIQFSDSTSWSEAAVISMSMQGTPNNDNLQGFETNDTMNGGDGNDAIYGKDGNDTLYGDAGGDSLNGENGNDILYGGDGNDTLTGGNGDDILDGGPGTYDFLNGNAGNDTYLWSLGNGNTNISNYDTAVGRNDVLIFGVGINPGDVIVTRTSNNLVLTMQGSGEKITVVNYFYNSTSALNAIQFNNGTSWDEPTVWGMVP